MIPFAKPQSLPSACRAHTSCGDTIRGLKRLLRRVPIQRELEKTFSAPHFYLEAVRVGNATVCLRRAIYRPG